MCRTISHTRASSLTNVRVYTEHVQSGVGGGGDLASIMAARRRKVDASLVGDDELDTPNIDSKGRGRVKRSEEAMHKVCFCESQCTSVSVYVSVSVRVCLCLSVCLAVFLSVFLCVCLSVYLSICVSVYLSIYLSVYLFVCLSIYLSCLSICLSICLTLSMRARSLFVLLFACLPAIGSLILSRRAFSLA